MNVVSTQLTDEAAPRRFIGLPFLHPTAEVHNTSTI
jgi:hypothetical protein